MAAKKKEIKEVTLAELGVDARAEDDREAVRGAAGAARRA